MCVRSMPVTAVFHFAYQTFGGLIVSEILAFFLPKGNISNENVFFWVSESMSHRKGFVEKNKSFWPWNQLIVLGVPTDETSLSIQLTIFPLSNQRLFRFGEE